MSDWHFINILAPMFLPLAVLGLLSMFSMPAALRTHPFLAIKDGQLSWAGLAMSLNALYELRHPAKHLWIPDSWSTTMFWFAIASLLAHVLFAALGSLFPTQVVERSGFRHALIHYRVPIVSTVFTLFTAYLYSEIHLTSQIGQP